MFTSDAPLRDETALLRALRAGDEDAFREVVLSHQPGLLRVARMYVPEAIASEVVQETWVAVVAGLDRFEARSSLKTWIYRILLNQARKRGPRERRTIPFAARTGPLAEDGPTVDPARLVHPQLGRGYWPNTPPVWHGDPEGRLLDGETLAVVRGAIAGLPDAQREVITLRDVEGWSADEVCDLLGLSSANQRVLLHRARAAVRQRLEVYFDGHA